MVFPKIVTDWSRDLSVNSLARKRLFVNIVTRKLKGAITVYQNSPQFGIFANDEMLMSLLK